jgi:outer membrane protein TolC
MNRDATQRLLPVRLCWSLLVGLIAVSPSVAAGPEIVATPNVNARPQILTLEAAVHYALENNPTLAYQRQQHHIAAAHVVIADTYPFNPVLENRIQGASGPASAGITNNLPLEHVLLWEVELQHQGRYRRDQACAALSRTDWEIAHQEQTLAVQVIRAYYAVVYRQEKLRLLEQTQRLNDQLIEDVSKLAENVGKLGAGDRLVAQTEADTSHDLLHGGQQLLIAARSELYRALGIVEGSFTIESELELPSMSYDPNALKELALARRADLHAFEMAVVESNASLRLAVASRRGNPTVGPAFTYDPTRISMIGIQVNVPIPFPNRHHGEIKANEAELAQAHGKLEAARFDVQQDVNTALSRLAVAERRAEFIRREALPRTERAVEEMNKLFQVGQAGVDILKIIDLRRKLLQLRESYLDAIWEVNQARADILAATGEPVLGLCNSVVPNPQPAAPIPTNPPAKQLIPEAPAKQPTLEMPASFAPPAPKQPQNQADDDIWTAPRNSPKRP